VRVQPDPEAIVNGYRPYVLYTFSSNSSGIFSVAISDGGIKVVSVSGLVATKREEDEDFDNVDLVIMFVFCCDGLTDDDVGETPKACVKLLLMKSDRVMKTLGNSNTTIFKI